MLRTIFALLLALCAGCGGQALLNSLPPNTFIEGDRMTIEYAFTDAAAESAHKRAEAICSQKREVAVRTGGTCSLTRCLAYYQCATQAEAAAFQADQPGKK